MSETGSGPSVFEKFKKKRVQVGSTTIGPEAGVDPLPINDGPLDPLWAAWSVVGAWPVSFGLMMGAMAVTIPASVFVPFERVQRWGGAQLCGACLRATLSKVRVNYHPKFDKAQQSVYMMNHTSVLDAHAALYAIPQPFCGIMFAHHFDIPVYGTLMKAANGIGVERGGTKQTREVARQFRDRIDRGISILGFPEGRRTQNGRILPFRSGLFRMSRDAGVPVVPLMVKGLWAVLPKREWIVRPGEIEIYVGPQIQTEGMDDKRLNTLAKQMQVLTADYVERGELGDVGALLDV